MRDFPLHLQRSVSYVRYRSKTFAPFLQNSGILSYPPGSTLEHKANACLLHSSILLPSASEHLLKGEGQSNDFTHVTLHRLSSWRQCGVAVRARDWASGFLGSTPASAADLWAGRSPSLYLFSHPINGHKIRTHPCKVRLNHQMKSK